MAIKAAGLERGGAGFSPRPRQRACQVPLTRQGGDALTLPSLFHIVTHIVSFPMKWRLQANVGMVPMQVNAAWYQLPTSIMLSKNLLVGIRVVILVKYWCLVAMSVRRENLYIPKLLVGLIPFWSILMLGWFRLGMKVLTWIYKLWMDQNKNTIKSPCPTSIEKIIMKSSFWRPKGIPKKNDTRPTLH